MTEIEFADNRAQIDAGVVARAFQISPEALKTQMREGTITSRFERGMDEDAGKVRLTFYSATRRVRITADDSGAVLKCSAADIARPMPQGAAPRPGDTAGTEPSEALSRIRLDALLDDALRGSFPASDPIAVSFDSPALTGRSAD